VAKTLVRDMLWELVDPLLSLQSLEGVSQK